MRHATYRRQTSPISGTLHNAEDILTRFSWTILKILSQQTGLSLTCAYRSSSRVGFILNGTSRIFPWEWNYNLLGTLFFRT
jgi:hypothetical protein